MSAPTILNPLVQELKKIALPPDHYKGPSIGLSTENGDSWLSAGNKINALIDRVHELEAMIKNFFTTGQPTKPAPTAPQVQTVPPPATPIVTPPAASSPVVPTVSPLAPPVIAPVSTPPAPVVTAPPIPAPTPVTQTTPA